ncbi:MAG TPA: citramalate synthase [Methylocella sp.]|nr:citramalate synthase [Methylocella sp.]
MREKLSLLDTTLRDGAQMADVDFSLADKRQIAMLLDGLGIDYIEGGYPGANPLDTEFFARKHPCKAAKLVAFGMTKRAGRSAANDPGVACLLASNADCISFVGKAWDYHVRVALGCTLEENLENISQSIAAARDSGREVLFDCEHFFDGFKANQGYALEVAKTAYAAGARWIVLCDTNGGTLPHEIEPIVAVVKERVPGSHLGIHAHDDTGNAVANSLAAVRAGVRHIQGTLNGLGERCGNANLVSIIPTLLLKRDFADHFEIGVTLDKLVSLTKISHTLDELLNRAPNWHAPYVGASAFATKAGIHASAVIKEPKTYEHIAPEAVGNKRRLLISDQAGKSNILAELERIGVRLDKGDPRVLHLLEEVKQKESLGYAYEGADASFELLARRMLGEVPDYFEVERFRVDVERRHNAQGELVSVSEAVVKVNIDGETLISAAEGEGPVNALDLALRKDLGKYQRFIEDLELIDFRVRIFHGGTDAVTRVLIEFSDGTGENWSTVGVSANIIDASFQALTDAITFKLLKSGAR